MPENNFKFKKRNFESLNESTLKIKSNKKTISLSIFILFSVILSLNAFAAKDFIVENKTSALFIINGTTGNIILTPSFGLVGIGTINPINALTVIGSVTSFGSLNATFINATEIRIGNNLIPTLGAFNNANYTALEDSAFRIVNFTTQINNYIPSFFNNENFTNLKPFTLANYSAEYASTGFKIINFTNNYDSRADRFGNANYSSLAPFTLANYSSEYGSSGFKIANYTALENAAFTNANYSNLNNSLWNLSRNLILYPKDATFLIRIGDVNRNISNDTFAVIGSAAVYGSLNSTSFNSSFILQNNNQVQTINAVFNNVNYTALENAAFTNTNYTNLEAAAFNKANYSSEYASTGFKNANYTALEDAAFRIANFTTNYEAQAYFKIANYTALENAAFTNVNYSNLNTTQWNLSRNLILYPKDAAFLVRIGDVNRNISNDTFAVIGSAAVYGSLNSTSFNSSFILQNNNQVQTVNAVFNNVNYTALENAAFTNTNYTNLEAAAFTKANYSAEYASTGFKIINFTSNYENQAYFKIANYTALENAAFTNTNYSNLNNSLWNLSRNLFVYLKDATYLVRIGDVNRNISNDTFAVIGSAAVYGSLNSTSFNSSFILQNGNQVQTVNAVFNNGNYTALENAAFTNTNYTSLEASAFTKVNYSAEYASTGFKNANYTSLEDAAFRIANFTTNYENQAYFKIANYTALNTTQWNSSGNNIYNRNFGGNVGIGIINPAYTFQVADTGTATAVNLSDVLYVDASNNRVGIGNSSPEAKLHINADSTLTLLVDRHTGDNIWRSRMTRGTSAAPTATLNGDRLLQLAGAGYGATGYTTDRALIDFITTESWTDSAQGAEIRFSTTATGGTTTSEKMRIQQDGSVGIGTTSPQTLLNVKGSSPRIRISGSAQSESVILDLLQNDTSSAEVGWFVYNEADTIDLIFRRVFGGTGSTFMMIDNTTGNVGIGTTAPEGKLHIWSATAGTVTPHNTGDDLVIEGGTDSGLSIVTPDASTGRILWTSPATTSDIGARIMYKQSTNLMSIGPGGGSLYLNGSNVGIGTDGPGEELEVYSTGSSVIRLRDSGATGTATASYVEFGGTDGGAFNTTGYVGDGSSGNLQISLESYWGPLRFATGSTGSTTERMRIDTSGNVGIGTTSPAERLSLQNGNFSIGNDTETRLYVDNRTGGVGIGTTNITGRDGTTALLTVAANTAYASNRDSGQVRIQGVDNSSRKLVLGVDTAQSPAFGFIQATESFVSTRNLALNPSGGNVGIGTTSPKATFNPVGDVYINLSTDAKDFEIVNGSGTSLLFVDSSAKNVGIGTTVPGQKLTVVGDVNVSGSLNVSSGLNVINGNVGIGTTAPLAKLHSAGTYPGIFDVTSNLTATRVDPTGYTYGSIVMGGNGANQYYGISVGGMGRSVADRRIADLSFHSFNTDNNLATTVGASIRGLSEDAITTNYGMNLAFLTRTVTSALTEQMRITAAGNVGIGTTTPSNKLEVSGNVSVTGNTLLATSSGNVGIGLTGPRSLLEIQKTTGNTLLGVPSNALLTLSQGGALNELSQIGLGYTTVSTSAAAIAYITTSAAGQTNGAITFATRSVTTDTAPSERMRIDSSGNVGIGTTGPASTLTVVGNFSATGTKSAVVNTSYGIRKLYAIESPDVSFYDRGKSSLTNGIANISLDPIFIETVEPDYQVFLTPEADTAGIYVAEKAKEYFIVKGRNKNSNIPFSWLLSALRKGYGATRLDSERKENTEIIAVIDEENKLTDVNIINNLNNGKTSNASGENKKTETNAITGKVTDEITKANNEKSANENKFAVASNKENEIINEIKKNTNLDLEQIKKSITFRRKEQKKEKFEEENPTPELPHDLKNLSQIAQKISIINGSIVLRLG